MNLTFLEITWQMRLGVALGHFIKVKIFVAHYNTIVNSINEAF